MTVPGGGSPLARPCGPWRKGKVKGRERPRQATSPGAAPLHGKGRDTSTRPCQHYDQRLPDNVVCHARCPAYPACLPPGWAGLSTDLGRFLARWADHQASTTTSEGLDREDEQLWGT